MKSTLQQGLPLRIMVEYLDRVEAIGSVPPGERTAEEHRQRGRGHLPLLQYAI